jgi:transposase
VELSDRDWERLAPLIREPKRRRDGKGRRRHDPRRVLSGILWVLRSGARWKDLPKRFPSYQTCHRRFQQWQANGSFERILFALGAELRARHRLDLRESAIDGSFASAKKGALSSEKRSAARGRRS